jgi:sugar/nucleoside kinase (ribokinase family)
MKITFIGHLCRDVNIIDGVSHPMFGGGVFHNGMTAKGLGARPTVLTRCTEADVEPMTGALVAAGVEVRVRPSAATTSIENLYPDSDPDHRRSRLLARGGAFEARDVDTIQADAVHVNPLWHGEFPVDLLPALRARVSLLGGDAQGFLRTADGDGRLVLRDWADKARWMPLFDVFKADISEAEILTGTREIQPAAQALHALGAREIVLTHGEGVCVYDGGTFHEEPFGTYSLAGRTGRGDTCSAAYLVGRSRLGVGDAAGFAARITSMKLQYPGPFRGFG